MSEKTSRNRQEGGGQGVRSRRRNSRSASGAGDGIRPVRNEGAVILMTVAAILISAVIIAAAIYFVIGYIIGPGASAMPGEEPETEAVSGEEAGTGELSVPEQRLLGIRDSLSIGASVLATLRTYYPDDLVMYKNSKYVFVPRDYSLKTHDYKSEDVTVLESGEYEYAGRETRKGIDVSSHQGEIDWEAVSGTDLDFVFIRALYRGYETGKLVEDERFAANLAGAKDAGLSRGVYIFTQALNEEEADEEIELLLSLLGDDVPELPVVLDVEEAGGGEGRMDQLSAEERTELISYYCRVLEEKGFEPMIYFNMGGALLMLDLSELEDYPKWFASYDTDFYYPYEYTVWQYADTGSIDGIDTPVDLDLYFGEF